MAVQTEKVHGECRTPPDAPATLIEAAAWWLLTGEASPTYMTRIGYGKHEEIAIRSHLEVQVGRIMEAAEVAGIGEALSAVLVELFAQPATEQSTLLKEPPCHDHMN